MQHININGAISNITVADSINTNQYIQVDTNADFEEGNLLKDLIDKSVRMCERKYTKKIEDLYNDDFTDWLRDKGYYTTDQTRSGKSLKTAGEIDIMVRSKNGTPVSIIEAFRLSSCGIDNEIVVAHIDKLLNNYDTIGNKDNFILIYSEASDFNRLWINYLEYISKINNNMLFNSQCKLISFTDVSDLHSSKSGVRVGFAKHERDGKGLNVYHLFINMFV